MAKPLLFAMCPPAVRTLVVSAFRASEPIGPLMLVWYPVVAIRQILDDEVDQREILFVQDGILTTLHEFNDDNPQCPGYLLTAEWHPDKDEEEVELIKEHLFRRILDYELRTPEVRARIEARIRELEPKFDELSFGDMPGPEPSRHTQSLFPDSAMGE